MDFLRILKKILMWFLMNVCQVFGSEPVLYDDGKLNHRHKPENIAVYSHLLEKGSDVLSEMTLKKIQGVPGQCGTN